MSLTKCVKSVIGGNTDSLDAIPCLCQGCVSCCRRAYLDGVSHRRHVSVRILQIRCVTPDPVSAYCNVPFLRLIDQSAHQTLS